MSDDPPPLPLHGNQKPRVGSHIKLSVIIIVGVCIAIASLPIIASIYAFLGFERQARIDSLKSFSSEYLSFDYPGNWEITDEIILEDYLYLYIETPGDALVIVQSDSETETADVMDFAKSFSDDATPEGPVFNASKFHFTKLKKKNGFDMVEEKFNFSFLGQVVPHQRIFATKPMGEGTIFVVYQVALEDLSKTEPGYDVIMKTLTLKNREQKAEGK